MTKAKGVAILGSTGSIGQTTLEVISAFPDQFRVVALTANKNADLLQEQAERFRPGLTVLADDSVDTQASSIRIGWDAVLEAAAYPDAEIVVNGLVGAAGLEPTLLALEAGKREAVSDPAG